MMLLINCPYCGERAQTEFAYYGEAHIARPEKPEGLSDAAWADYLFLRTNPKGIHFERWMHAHGCRRFFNMMRDTVSGEIFATYKMGGKKPAIPAASKKGATPAINTTKTIGKTKAADNKSTDGNNKPAGDKAATSAADDDNAGNDKPATAKVDNKAAIAADKKSIDKSGDNKIRVIGKSNNKRRAKDE